MNSFSLYYDAEDDWLDVTFGYPEELTRSVPLNDQITVYTNSAMSRITRVTMAEYGRMILVNETEFTVLRDEDPYLIEDILYLLRRPPVNKLLLVTDAEALIARVLSPTIQELFSD